VKDGGLNFTTRETTFFDKSTLLKANKQGKAEEITDEGLQQGRGSFICLLLLLVNKT
jgi:hypothetical protein